jgi:hypothetical protein
LKRNNPLAQVYKIRPREDNRGVDLISDALPFGRPAAQDCARIAFDRRALNDLPRSHQRFRHALPHTALCD